MRFVNVAFVTLDSATLLYTYISRFSVNPHYISRGRKSGKAAAINFIPQPLSISLFNFSHKWPTFAFTPESGYTTLGSAQRIAHSGTHGETGGVSDRDAITTLGALCVLLKRWTAGCQNGKLCRFGGLVGGAPEERRKPAGQRCAYARRCSEGVAAPLGCVALLPLLVQPDLLGWKDLTRRSGRVTITRNSRTASRLALVWEPLRAVK